MRRWAAVGAALSFAVGCHVFDDLDGAGAPEPILIGATIAQSGDLGAFGRTMTDGLQVAEGVINDAGGLLDRPVEIRVLDDETSEDLAVDNARRLIEEGAVGIVGPLTSGQALAVQEVTHEARVVTVSPTAGAPALGDAQPADDRYFFRTISTMRTGSGAAIALFAFSGPEGGRPCRRMAILYSDDATGVAFRDAIEELFEKQGGCIVSQVTIPPSEIVDYAPHVAALMEAVPDCAALVAWPEAGAEIVREHNAAVNGDPAWSDFFWLGTTALHGESFLTAARVEPTQPTPSEAEGFFGGDTDSTPDTREYRDFRTEYNRRLGIEPLDTETPTLVANTYDAALLIALAVERAATTSDRLAIRDALLQVTAVGDDHHAFGPSEVAEAFRAIGRGEEIHYKGASSSILFDETGTPSNPTLIWHVRSGAFEEVAHFSEADVEALIHAPATPDPACTD